MLPTFYDFVVYVLSHKSQRVLLLNIRQLHGKFQNSRLLYFI